MLDNKKKLVAVAIAGAFALPIAAQAQSSVEVYGKVYPQLVNSSFTNAAAKGAVVSTMGAAATGVADSSVFTMDAPNSRLGFRGKEDLGSGMKAFYQLEMAFSIDTGAGASTLFSRDTFVGLGGDFGSVKLGNMDTVYKSLGDTMSFLGVSSGNFISTSNILSKPGFGTSSASSFHLRRTNSIIYESPTIGGVQGLFDYSLGEVAGNPSKGSVISAGVKYEGGPFYLALAYETHNDLFGASKNIPTALKNDSNVLANSTDTALRGTVQYKFSQDARAEVNVASIKYDETGGTAGKFANYKHMTWSVAGEQKFGALTAVGSFGQGTSGSCSLVGTAPCSTDGMEGNNVNLGLGYNLSKRTLLYGLYSVIKNGSSAAYNNSGNGNPATGQTVTTVAAGISHSF